MKLEEIEMQEVVGKAFQEREAHRPSLKWQKEQPHVSCYEFLFAWLKSDGQVVHLQRQANLTAYGTSVVKPRLQRFGSP